MKHAGLTLVELLIAVGVLSVMTTLAVPALTQLIDAQRRMAITQDLASGIRSARVAAVTRNQIVTIHPIDADWSNGWRIILDPNGKGPGDDDAVLLERSHAAKTRVVGNSKVARFLSFDGLGGLRRAANGSLHVCVKGEPVSHYRVIVNITGRVRIQEARRYHAPCA